MRSSFKLSLLTTLLLTHFAYADDTALSEVSVTATSDATNTEQAKSYTTSAMKTTTGLELSPKETPQSVSVVTKVQLDNRGISRMEDALKNSTGVNVMKEGSRSRYQSRGFYIDQIEQDGISSTVPGSAINSHADAQSMTDLVVFDHIEVVRGATGLTQANGSAGGTINAVRKKPTAQTQIKGDVSFDRFGLARTTADVSGSLSEKVRGRFVSALEHNPTFKNTDNNLGVVYGVLEADVADYTRLTFGALSQRKQATPDPAGLVMSKEGEDLGLPYDKNLIASWNKAVYRKTELFTELDHYLSDTWKLNAKVAYTENRSDEKFGTLARRGNDDPSNLARIGILSKYKNKGDEVAAKLNLSGDYDLFGQTHQAFATYSYTRETGRSHEIDAVRDANATFDVYQFNGGLSEPDFNQRAWDGVSRNKFITHLVNAGTRFNATERLHLLLAGNYSWFKSDYQENAVRQNGTLYEENTLTRQHHFTPYAGITFDLNENNSLYASYTSIFKPSYGRKDKAGNQVKPKTGNNIEFGWKGSWNEGKLNASFALFQLDEKNRPISISKTQAQQEDPNADKGYTIADGRVRSRGWEAEIAGNLTENLKLFAGYTYNYAKYLRSESATTSSGMNFSTHTPKHMFRLYSEYRLPFDDGKWTIGGGVNAQSDTTSLNKIKQAGYAIWNANIQYAMSKHITLHLIGSNLFDKRYYQPHRTRNNVAGNYYGEPRNVMFKLDWTY